jgi:hypothetical protein
MNLDNMIVLVLRFAKYTSGPLYIDLKREESRGSHQAK